MKKILTTLGASLLLVSTANAMNYSNSFTDLTGLTPAGFSASAATLGADLDGTGSSAEVTGFASLDMVGLTAPTTGSFDFDFMFRQGSTITAPTSGNRFMLFSDGTSSNIGFGINFDVQYVNGTDDSLGYQAVIYARVGTGVGSAFTLDYDQTINVSGTATFVDATTASMSIDLSGFDTDGNAAAGNISIGATPFGALSNDIAFREASGANDDTYLFDGVNVSVIPEPSVLAFIMVAGGLLIRQRFRK